MKPFFTKKDSDRTYYGITPMISIDDANAKLEREGKVYYGSDSTIGFSWHTEESPFFSESTHKTLMLPPEPIE